MHKAVFALQRREDFSQEEFATYWRDEHAAIAVEDVPNVVEYTISFPDDPERAPYDGMATLYFEDRRALEEAMESRGMERATADVANFADPDSALQMIVEEQKVPVDRT